MQSYKCKLCGAILRWDEKSQKLKCKYCDSVYDVSEFEDKTKDAKLDNKEEKDKSFTQEQNTDNNWVIYSCKNCGAEVVAGKSTMATVCAYCGSTISVTEKTAENFRPKKIIPYIVDKKQAMKIYKEYINSSKYVPDKFAEQAVIEKMQNLFAPFYLNSMRVEVEATASSEAELIERSGYDEVVTTKMYNSLIKMRGALKNIPTDASKKMPNNLMDALEPFDYSQVVDFNPAYMAGYIADQPDEYAEEMMERAEQRSVSFIDNQVLKEVPHYSKRISGRNYKFINENSEYTMIPVWILNVNYKNKRYKFAINGQTGKMVGELPIDDKKLKKTCIKLPILFTLLFPLIGAFLYWVGIIRGFL